MKTPFRVFRQKYLKLKWGCLVVLFFTLLQIGCVVDGHTRRLTGQPTMSVADAVQTLSQWRSVNTHVLSLIETDSPNQLGETVRNPVLTLQSNSDTNIVYIDTVKKVTKTEKIANTGPYSGQVVQDWQLIPGDRYTIKKYYIITRPSCELDFSEIRKVGNMDWKFEGKRVIAVSLRRKVSLGANQTFVFICSSDEWLERLTQAFLVLCPNAR